MVLNDDVAGAERWLADLGTLVEPENIAFYPPRESFGEAEAHAEVAGERVETLERIGRGDLRIVVTTSRALLERTQLPHALTSARLELRKGDPTPEELAAHLEAIGFERVEWSRTSRSSACAAESSTFSSEWRSPCASSSG